MTSVLFVQFRKDPVSIAREERRHRHAAPSHIEFIFRSVFDFADAKELRDAAQRYTAVVFGGSGDFDIDGGRASNDEGKTTTSVILDHIRDTVTDIITHDRHFFGICFGHQLVAELYGGTISNDHAQTKIGTHTVLTLPYARTDPLFGQLPEVFYAQYEHKDSVTTLPEGATILAASPTCNFAALRYGNNVYTTQFHPEIEAHDMQIVTDNLSRYRHDISKPVPLHESPDASALLVRFYASLK